MFTEKLNHKNHPIAIIHYSPLEKYPPIINLLNYIEEREEKQLQYSVWTTKQDEDTFHPSNIKVIKLPGIEHQDNKIKRILNYLTFNIKVFFQLIGYKPQKILYYESISALPALLYKTIWNRNVEILVHYHEYTSPEEYQSGMVMTRIIHKLEQKIYKSYKWISHTNQTRADLFTKDNIDNNISNIKILPNYPPRSWIKNKTNLNAKVSSKPLKLVYVGALCTETMYTKELCNWVTQQYGNVTLDFWSQNISNQAEAYFKSNTSNWINLRGGINYHQLPAILSDYDIGVILYKGHIPNYVYNAPNKLFEYLVCGLDVIFPVELKGSYPFIWELSRPRVLKINFKELKDVNADYLISKRSIIEEREIKFIAEEVYSQLVDELK
ncbi:glycosyltransferase family protein [Pontibacter fetidus]|uniref:Glycosyltransferase family 4 protein n=1 Tax=Pontibacter fetidus TaxID=2700082 RepID=A0A6B2H434_9BACT|nr:glycosyltransferase family 4 protein [Pontibacter fetidus]NDK54520.1 glycosyltransferase family 4 protein [Pontibacter fetidus]